MRSAHDLGSWLNGIKSPKKETSISSQGDESNLRRSKSPKIGSRSDFAGGSPLVLRGNVHTRPESGAFPCPFCHCGEVLLIGETHACLYYRCAVCAETWTAVPAAAIKSQPDMRPTVH